MANDSAAAAKSSLSLPTSLRIITLNCWGLKFLSTHRHARLTEIGHQLAKASPPPSIVALQECWTQQDYLTIRSLTKDVLPHGKFYFSGVFGGGLAILSRWPIEESSMFRYPLNGRPAAFFRGDWYVGKGVASARIRLGPGIKDILEVFCTHLHAPYEQDDSYLCHRTAQAWEVAKLMRHAAERGHTVLGLGDFNMFPLSRLHRLIEAHSPLRDLWRVVKPDSALGPAQAEMERARGKPVPSAKECLDEHGATCDGLLNTWKWSKSLRKDLDRGRDTDIDPETPDPKARRLDYIFLYDNTADPNDMWKIDSIEVGMTMRHPTLKCSLSDHFSVEATLSRKSGKSLELPPPMVSSLPVETYDAILDMIALYELRERKQQRSQLVNFWAQTCIAIGCLVAVWWSPRNFVAFLLMLLSTLGFGAGILTGLMGFLFVNSELRALKEFEYEIRRARERAKAASPDT